ncbi:hypothetical protein EXU57_08190 [Segetibacter sp. 3557_3]|uniref:hypothetical protein n=1 Tax=Segetibacter sp. 3557_3 TaxID=2547429 RepID=UPI00105876B3|nr:hypothetical protein [Segetibacter sp. 3557_3]TDH26781.1 hypothetical protein EXU57_08190 [Segetibacter sp. 3557_3]
MEEQKSRPEPTEADAANIPSIITEVKSTADEPVEQDKSLQTFKLYEHGITNGLMSIPPEMFERFISYYYEEINKDHRINETKDEIASLSDTYTKARAKRLDLVSKELEQRAEHGILILESNDIENKIKFWQDKLSRAKETINELKENVKTDYSLLAAIIFFVFAILFIGADYGIALNIVATNLQIGTSTDGQGTVHITYIAYMFAIAIAGLSVVLKPAYDRLIEKPYHNSKAKKRFAIFIITSSILVLAMLVAFGIFREEMISKDLGLNDASTSIDANSNSTQPNAESSSSSSPAAAFAIISSTFLFAIAGAVSLGISIPVIYKSYRITWNNLRQKLWNNKIFNLARRKVAIESKRLRAEQAIKLVEEELSDLQEELGHKELIKDKKELLQVFVGSKMHKLIEKSKAIYQDGYYRGAKLSGKVTDEWLNDSVMSSTQYSNAVSSSALPASTSNIHSRTRPFVALRRMISQNFRNKANKDGNVNFEYYDFDK